MCGIAGLFEINGRSRDGALAETAHADGRHARPSRPRRQRCLGGPGGGHRARPSPSCHHRPVARPARSRCIRRTGDTSSASTAKSIISANCARELEARGHTLPRHLRHRSHAGRLQRMGTDASRPALRRHVRLRGVRPARRERCASCATGSASSRFIGRSPTDGCCSARSCAR